MREVGKWLLLLLLFVPLSLSACTVDRNGVRDPVAEAKAQAIQSATDIQRRNAEADLDIRQQTAKMEIEAKQAELELRQRKAEAEAQATEQSILMQSEATAQVVRSFGTALSIILVLGALAGVIWIVGFSYGRARNAVLASGYINIGVEPSTMLPPPLIISADGYLIDTRSGERCRLRDAAGVNRLRMAATTRNTDTAILTRGATDIARSSKGKQSGAAQAADVLPAIAASVPTLDHSEDRPFKPYHADSDQHQPSRPQANLAEPPSMLQEPYRMDVPDRTSVPSELAGP